ncbi:hypothetical protein [Actinosynnema sp. NPDC023587]|uniref:hypothetical protein n=1 Tax=Actinosynnema sp. NPDC023587 TaxID=3154695 RepID=UPI0033CD4CB6
MPSFSPVIRVDPPGGGFAAGPVAAPGGSWLHLDGNADRQDVGSALRALYLAAGGRGAGTPDEAVHELIGFDVLYAPGGLLLRDEDTCVEPGPRSDLFAWRTWLAALYRGEVDLGPGPWVEYAGGDVVRVWPGEGRAGPSVDFARKALPGMLRKAQRDLTEFLGALRGWAAVHSPTQVELLVAAVDAGWEITEPLPV